MPVPLVGFDKALGALVLCSVLMLVLYHCQLFFNRPTAEIIILVCQLSSILGW